MYDVRRSDEVCRGRPEKYSGGPPGIMPAPAGLCEGCSSPMQWTFIGELFVRCRYCTDLFEMDDPGTVNAGEDTERERERG